MRTQLLLLLLVATIISCRQAVKGPNGVSYHSAVEYNDYIVARQERVVKNILGFRDLAGTDLDTADSLLKRYARQTDTIIQEIKGMPAYRGDTVLRQAALGSFSFYKRIFEVEYPPVISFRKKPSIELTEQDIAEVKEILGRIGTEEKRLDAAFHKAQKEYAERNNMKITENAMQEEINKAKKKD